MTNIALDKEEMQGGGGGSERTKPRYVYARI